MADLAQGGPLGVGQQESAFQLGPRSGGGATAGAGAGCTPIPISGLWRG